MLLAVMFFGLSGYAGVASLHQAALVRSVAEAGSDTDAYQEAAYQVTHEMALLQAAMREPDGEERRQLRAANAQADAAMQRMAAVDAEHHLSALALADQHHRLAPILAGFLAQLDRDDTGAAFTTLEVLLEPEYQEMITQMAQEKDVHLAEYDRQQSDAKRESERSALAVVIVFVLGLLVLAGIRLIGLAHRRQVETMAATDPLTGLPNRNAFAARTERALIRGPDVTVLVLNIDGFRDVNEQLGQRIGDLILAEAGRRISSQVRGDDVVARLGGDEFAVLLADDSPAAGESLATRLSDEFARSFDVDEVVIDLEVSIGAAVSEPGDDATTVLRHADAAMHVAKQAHGGFHTYREESRQDTVARLALLGDLRRALDDPGQLTLHYQPQVSVASGKLIGVEALARWQHPTRGSVSPAEFIPVLEVSSLMHRFTTQMLTKALRQARNWLDAGHKITMSVNISTRSLLDATFPGRVADLLTETGVPGPQLCIEVTEYALMNDPDAAIQSLQRLRDLGVKVSIDDYGTGYSSMAYLKVLPVDELKIDRSFVKDIAGDDSSRALVASTVELGHSLGLEVVAEGVEDGESVAALQLIGCDIAQGYHFARPLPAEELTARMASTLQTN
ncbi:diguanylate cyclase (GGDEF)-like protein [Actinoplanes tereljensis]|uniref:Diguanylate cyclase/phosphodiesterase n=1 Tax=Paractinoplanes tereljensis TaxID=571912 RepID=A0A919NQU7_9ACTN|nr:bifunctional diguanylate cyclase/phosphodiesterase [Actinoplanes tereljensis]GIF23380.1 hypothetical protein Ate02nite_61100 [Actinoplanes tereljensis]